MNRGAWWALAVAAVFSACGDGSGGSLDGGKGGGTGNKDGGADPNAPPTPPVLSQATLRVTGRHGQDYQLVVKGSDVNADVEHGQVTFKGAAGQAIPLFDSNADGQTDTGATALPPSGMVNKASFELTVTYPGLAAQAPEVTSVDVEAWDEGDRSSGVLNAQVQPQPVKQLGEACDPRFVLDRCAPGLGCKGASPVCAEGEAPRVDKAGYFKDPGGPLIRALVSDADGDASFVRVDFQDATGKPVLVDLDGDGNGDASTTDMGSLATVGPTTALLSVQSAVGFGDTVKKIAFVPVDSAGHEGAPVVTSLVDLPTRSVGQACSPYGFDKCSATGACAQGTNGNFTCVSLVTSRTNACKQAPVLGPVSGITHLVGATAGNPSLWDPPLGCAAQDPRLRPDAIASLQLASPAGKVRVSTAHPGTNFDSVLYLLPSCDGAEPLACNDDAPASSGSTLELLNLASGNYFIVVDSWDAAGGTFDLTVDVEP